MITSGNVIPVPTSNRRTPPSNRHARRPTGGNSTAAADITLRLEDGGSSRNTGLKRIDRYASPAVDKRFVAVVHRVGYAVASGTRFASNSRGKRGAGTLRPSPAPHIFGARGDLTEPGRRTGLAHVP